MFGQVWLIRIATILLAASVVNAEWGKNGQKDSSCVKPKLQNGRIKMRSSGRVVKFACRGGYYIVGETTATCLRRQWTSEPPVCAAKGCPDIPSPESGRLVKTVFGTVLVVECNPGYILDGSPMLYCDGYEWNGTLPLCQASGTKSSLSCDFEDDLCGWIQDSIDDFDWKHQNLGTPSGHLGTGPSYDHTLGETKSGYYLYIESSSPRIINDTARLYSPVYGPDSVSDGCFTFWYHMYGSSSGQLRVYVKVESQKLEDVDASFIQSGDQGQRWRQGYIHIPNVTENFQVVIEGVRGSGYVSDTAIDDVKLTSGEECKMAAIASQVDASDDEKSNSNAPIASNSTCFSRCSTTGTADESTCSCHDSCLLNATCCLDYLSFCLTDGVQSDDSVAYGESRINYSSEDNPSSAGGGSVAMISIGGAVTGCLLVTTLVMISLIRWWNRRLITSRQNHNQDVLADDSDVRYLRDEDEVQLDLTEARPQSKFADFQQL